MKGEIHDLPECPTHFSSLEDEDTQREVNFLTDGEEALMELKWKFSDAAEAVKEAYDADLKKHEDTTKADIVAQILDARYRALDLDPNTQV